MPKKKTQHKEPFFNARLEIKKNSAFIKLVDDSVASPLYGKVDASVQDSDGYDERNYRNSIFRHSPLFEHMRKLRANIASTSGFYDDKGTEIKGNAHPGSFEQYIDGYFEITPERKLIRLSEGNEIELSPDGESAVWRTPDPLVPEIHFKKGERVADAFFPHLDFLLRLSDDVTLPQKSCVTTHLWNSITEKGGELTIEYIIEIDGLEAEKTGLSVKVFPYPENCS